MLPGLHRLLWGVAVAAGIVVAGSTVAGAEENTLVITDPVNEVPEVLDPEPGDLARLASDSAGTWHVLIQVSNSDFGIETSADGGPTVFEALPSVGVFDTLEERLQWTNAQFRCAVDPQCEGTPLTPDGEAFGTEFLQLVRLYDEQTGTIAHYVEHASLVGKEPAQWLSEQAALTLAIPFAPMGPGDRAIWVGYTYLYTSDMEGTLVQFAPEAMAVTEVSVTVPEPPISEDSDPRSGDTLPLGTVDETTNQLPSWAPATVLGVSTLAVLGLGMWVVLRRLRASTRARRDSATL